MLKVKGHAQVPSVFYFGGLPLIFVGAAGFAVGMVVGVDAAASGTYGQDLTIAIVIAIVAVVLAISLSLLLVRRRGRDSQFL